MFRFEQFEGWKRSIRWGRAVMKLTATFPQIYQFSLGEQLRRAALSVSANLAEGSGRETIKERCHFYQIAKGSLYESVSLLVMVKEEGLIEEGLHRRYYNEADEIASIITSSIITMRRQTKP